MISSEMKKRIVKYLTNEANSEDLNLLSEWITDEGNKQIFDQYVREHYEITMAMNRPDIEKIKKNLLQKIKRDKKLFYLGRARSLMKYAAVGLVFLVAGFFFRQDNFKAWDDGSGLAPKETSVTVVLDDGTVDIINPDENRKVRDANGRVIGNQDGSKLTYRESPTSEKPVYSTLNVPYGKRFDVVLSDGTHVFLNSGTSLRYPVHFLKGHDRAVFLTGEAYFDVAKDEEHPFVVNANELAIEVLGTRFNVSHYPEDSSINTVLVEGSVELHKRKGGSEKGEAVLLEPGFKAEWQKADGAITVENVDTHIHTGWVQGKLIFRNTTFQKIRQALSRKYNVTIKNENKNLDEQLFDATFDIETVEEILESFNKSYAIKYKIEQNEVIIQ